MFFEQQTHKVSNRRVGFVARLCPLACQETNTCLFGYEQNVEPLSGICKSHSLYYIPITIGIIVRYATIAQTFDRIEFCYPQHLTPEVLSALLKSQTKNQNHLQYFRYTYTPANSTKAIFLYQNAKKIYLLRATNLSVERVD